MKSLALTAFAVSLLGLSAAAAGTATAAAGRGLTDFEDYRQVPIRNAILVKLIEDAEMIVAVNFKLKDVPAAAEGMSRWQAEVPAYCKELVPSVYKNGKARTKIMLEGDPKAFENSAGPYVAKSAFKPMDTYLVFLKKAGGAYRCVDTNPGGFRFYHASGPTDHRQLFVGRVNGRLVVEGNLGYKGSRMTGPTLLLDMLRGLDLGAKLTARALGGASVELRLEGAKAPQELALRAPLLWAEIEGPETDSVLLSPEDYVLARAGNPYEKLGGAATVRVELPTRPVPEEASLIWAHNNHRKPLAGSLPEGKHTVRFLCHVTEKALVISNPVTVEGKAGGARPAALAKLNGVSPYVPQADTSKAGSAGALGKAQLRGEIYFQSNRTGDWDIFVMNADGSNVRNLTNTPAVDEHWPRPSPDGKRMTYMTGKARLNIWDIKKPKGKAVWIMDRDGKNAKKLAENATRPSWGPDGKAIVYTQAGRRKNVTCVHHLETGKVTHPLDKWKSWLRADGEAVFSSSKRRIALGGKLWTTTGGALMIMDLDENYEPVKLTPLGAGYCGCNPQWSASGERLYFAHHDPKYNGAIVLWSVKPDGKDPHRFETPTQKRWEGYGIYCESPDGTMIAYGHWGDVYVMRLSDGAKVKLTEKQGKIQNGAPRWHPGIDGR